MPTPARRSTPRRGRSSSVVSNASTNPPNSPPSSARKLKKEITVEHKLKFNRPQLPTKRNPRLEHLDEVPVKLQVIKREGQSIIIGRVKLPTVNGQDHTFLLKRFDTNAIAASSMFRLAFPYANGEAESTEMRYLDARYDTDRANGGYHSDDKKATPDTPTKKARGRPKRGDAAKKDTETDTESVADGSANEKVKLLPEGSTGVRLQGTWIPALEAIEVAEEYGILKYARPLIEATAKHPDQGGAPVLVSSPYKNDTVEPDSSRKRQRTAKVDSESRGSESPRTRSAHQSKTGTAKRNAVTRSKIEMVAEDSDEEDNDEEDNDQEDNEEEEKERKKSSLFQLTQAEIDAQIEEAKALATGFKQVSNASTSNSPSRGKKRRAVNDRPTAELETVDDDQDDQDVGLVTRAFRRGTRAVRRRPIATTASVLTAAGAIGAGAAAWMAGGNFDLAIQTLQQSIQNLGITGWLF